MDGMTRTNTLSQCHVRHYHECGQTRENVTCEGVLFTKSTLFVCPYQTPFRGNALGCPEAGVCPSAVQNEHWEHGRCVHETKREVLASGCPCVQGLRMRRWLCWNYGGEDEEELRNPNRTRLLFDLLKAKLAYAGLRLHAEKTMTWNKRGSRFWAPLWVQIDSCRKQRRPGWKKRTAFGKPCHRFQRVPGMLSFKP